MAEMDSERLDVSKLASSLPLKLMCYNLELGTWEYDWALRLAQHKDVLHGENVILRPKAEGLVMSQLRTGVRLAIVGEDNSKS